MTDTIAKALEGLSAEDAAQALTDALQAVSAKLEPVKGLQLSRAVKDAAEKRSGEISAALVASVNGVPGKYRDFTVVDVAGRASVDTRALADQFPDAYNAVVSWGKPYTTVRINKAAPSGDDDSDT